MIDTFIDIISKLNGGNVIHETDNSESEVLLGESGIKLYMSNNKYYFMSEYNDDYNLIENRIRENSVIRDIEDIKPNNSYLILFYKITFFDEQISKKVIKLEENEFFYKKYIFYYTQKEFDSFKEWFYSHDYTLSEIWELSECNPESECLYIQFLLRLIIKVPFINFEFKRIEHETFDKILDNQLNGIRNNKEEVKNLFEQLSQKLATESVDNVAQSLFSNIVGGISNEN